MLNYGYILYEENNKKNFSLFHQPKIKCKEKYKASGNILNFFYLRYSKNKTHEEKSIKKLIYFLKQYQTKYITLTDDLPKYASLFQDEGFYVIDGSAIKKHLLVQIFFSYLKTNRIDVRKTGIHICANAIEDIEFFFDKISRINTVFSMCTENERVYDTILNKYGIAVHFSDTVSNKIIIYHNGKIPYSTNSHLIDLSVVNHKISFSKFPDLFSRITSAEAELLLRMNYSSCDDGFYDSGIKIACY